MGTVRVGWGLNEVARSIGRDPFEPEKLHTRGFDWQMVRVGHWIALGPSVPGKGGRGLYRCVSRCGVASVFRRDALAAGATLTCEGCRAGAKAPAAARVVPEKYMLVWHTSWEDIAVEERTNLKGRKAPADWDQYGRAALLAVIDRTGLGRDFGWKAFIRDCHELAGARTGAVVRVRAVNDSQRRIELSIRPTNGTHTFEVDLAVGRSDRPFPEIRKCVELALAADLPAPAVAPAPVQETVAVLPLPVSVPVPVPAPPILAGLDLARLLKMRDGFDTLINVGKDLQTANELKGELEVTLAAAEAHAEPLRAKFEAAQAVARECVVQAEEAQNAAHELNRKLAEAMKERDRCSGERAAAQRALEEAERGYTPAREQVESARRQLAEAQQLENERLRTLGKADELLPLLAALQKLSSPAA
ncbi:unnamed protein product [Gemmata massiliana]|uniref:Uncharacterized protein n=1 Tax=Gemmata massiliana TaxID=1210884 RepID=A0A6P2D015_9BACT|nr:hypothetical protein [Gemmata massiliana]VTR92800.1 unnamed protein product [Gemmata massiliana]